VDRGYKWIFSLPYMGQLIVSYYGLYANADRGKVKKALILSTLRMAEESGAYF